MDARRKASALWGVVGGLSFLVLAQGYVLVADGDVSFPIMLLVALVVATGSAVLTHVVRPRLSGKNESP